MGPNCSSFCQYRIKEEDEDMPFQRPSVDSQETRDNNQRSQQMEKNMKEDELLGSPINQNRGDGNNLDHNPALRFSQGSATLKDHKKQPQLDDSMIAADIIQLEEKDWSQGSKSENQILLEYSTPENLIRWFRMEDSQKGFLQLMSLAPLDQLFQKWLKKQPYTKLTNEHIAQEEPGLFKPFKNRDELVEDYTHLFPSYKQNLKIIVFQANDVIAFSFYMLIEGSDKSKTATIYDMMMSRNAYGQLKNPNEVLQNMISALEEIAWKNECAQVFVIDGMVDQVILQHLSFQKFGNLKEAFWKKQKP